uniref:MADF domain-containing protein n=1 Tax=Steinernema glaseri TaxID=37863 RepID=A0A1I7Y0P7_9BILA
MTGSDTLYDEIRKHKVLCSFVRDRDNPLEREAAWQEIKRKFDSNPKTTGPVDIHLIKKHWYGVVKKIAKNQCPRSAVCVLNFYRYDEESHLRGKRTSGSPNPGAQTWESPLQRLLEETDGQSRSSGELARNTPVTTPALDRTSPAEASAPSGSPNAPVRVSPSNFTHGDRCSPQTVFPNSTVPNPFYGQAQALYGLLQPHEMNSAAPRPPSGQHSMHPQMYQSNNRPNAPRVSPHPPNVNSFGNYGSGPAQQVHRGYGHQAMPSAPVRVPVSRPMHPSVFQAPPPVYQNGEASRPRSNAMADQPAPQGEVAEFSAAEYIRKVQAELKAKPVQKTQVQVTNHREAEKTTVKTKKVKPAAAIVIKPDPDAPTMAPAEEVVNPLVELTRITEGLPHQVESPVALAESTARPAEVPVVGPQAATVEAPVDVPSTESMQIPVAVTVQASLEETMEVPVAAAVTASVDDSLARPMSQPVEEPLVDAMAEPATTPVPTSSDHVDPEVEQMEVDEGRERTPSPRTQELFFTQVYERMVQMMKEDPKAFYEAQAESFKILGKYLK